MRSFKQYVTEQVNEVVFTFGRFNPPTTGHEKLLDAVSKTAGRNKYLVFASQSQDPKKNPLTYEQKVKYMRKMFPRHARNIMLDKSLKNVFDILVKLYDDGYNSVTMVVGSDRVKEFEGLLNRYNGVKGRHGLYDFNQINIVSAGERDPDAEGVSGMSASKMRAAALDNNLELFMKGLPSGFKDGKNLFNDVRTGMGLSESHDFRQHIQLQPVSEEREAYVQGKLFVEGDVVEYDNTVGQVIFLGANYVIVESAEGARSRKWISDIQLIERTDKESDLPQKYVSGIDAKSTKQARARHFEKGAKMDDDNPAAYKPAPGDATAKTKPSKYTKKFKQMFGEETKLAGKTYEHLELCPGAISAFERNMEDDGISAEKIRPAIDAVNHYLEVEAKVMEKGEATQADVDEISKRIEKAKKVIDELDLKGHTYHKLHLDKVKKKLKEEVVENSSKLLTYEEYESSFEGVMTENIKTALKNKAEKTGIAYGILKKVYDRGVAAWRTGHRPGTTPSQWGLARVNSFATGGKTRKTTDADLWKQHKGE